MSHDDSDSIWNEQGADHTGDDSNSAFALLSPESMSFLESGGRVDEGGADQYEGEGKEGRIEDFGGSERVHEEGWTNMSEKYSRGTRIAFS